MFKTYMGPIPYIWNAQSHSGNSTLLRTRFPSDIGRAAEARYYPLLDQLAMWKSENFILYSLGASITTPNKTHRLRSHIKSSLYTTHTTLYALRKIKITPSPSATPNAARIGDMGRPTPSECTLSRCAPVEQLPVPAVFPSLLAVILVEQCRALHPAEATVFNPMVFVALTTPPNLPSNAQHKNPSP